MSQHSKWLCGVFPCWSSVPHSLASSLGSSVTTLRHSILRLRVRTNPELWSPSHITLVQKPPMPNPNQVPISSKTQIFPRGLGWGWQQNPVGHPWPTHHPITFKHEERINNKTQRLRTSYRMAPFTCPTKWISDGQWEEGHGVVHHVQWKHHQSYLLHHYQNASIQVRQILCRKDQMLVSYVDKDMVEQSNNQSQFAWEKAIFSFEMPYDWLVSELAKRVSLESGPRKVSDNRKPELTLIRLPFLAALSPLLLRTDKTYFN